MRREPDARPRPGYTLIELLFVITILAILAGITANSLAHMNRAARVRASAERVVGLLHLARQKAISENAIFHVRIINAGPYEQRAALHRFPKAGDALSATTEDAVQNELGGWNPASEQGAYRNVMLDSQPLEGGVYFETEYRAATLWPSGSSRPASLAQLHGDPPSGLYYAFAQSATWLPRRTSSAPPSDATVLSFLPDGTASENVTLWVRDETHLFWVQVWRAGIIRSGQVTGPADFAAVYGP